MRTFLRSDYLFACVYVKEEFTWLLCALYLIFCLNLLFYLFIHIVICRALLICTQFSKSIEILRVEIFC